MKSNRAVIAIVAVNLDVLMFVFAEKGSALEYGSILRGRGLELADAGGQVRVRINMGSTGEVVMRLFDESGTIRVKMGASKDGSGLVLLNDSTEVGVHLLAKVTGTSLKLMNKDGRERLVSP
ncbi:MAG: hypothetical protein WEF53_14975 [Bacteroidota bacterium]